MDRTHAEQTAQSLAYYSSWVAAIAFLMFAQLANRVYTTATWIIYITGREMTVDWDLVVRAGPFCISTGFLFT